MPSKDGDGLLKTFAVRYDCGKCSWVKALCLIECILGLIMADLHSDSRTDAREFMQALLTFSTRVHSEDLQLRLDCHHLPANGSRGALHFLDRHSTSHAAQ